MAMKCKICTHNNRLEIDKEIVESGNLSKIAKKYDIPYGSLYTHANNHITRQLATAYATKSTEQNFDLLHRLDTLVSKAEDIFNRNYNKGKDSLALKALDSQRNVFELLAKISYSLHQAKIAEIDKIQAEKEKDKQIKTDDLEDGLDVLNIREQKVLMQLITKVKNKNPNTFVLSETYYPAEHLQPQQKETEQTEQAETEYQQDDLKNQLIDEDLKVKPINSLKINSDEND